MPHHDAFTVTTDIVDLAVTMRDGAVTEIRLNAGGVRPPTSAAEHRVAGELQDYAVGRRQEFTFPVRLEGTDFDHRVWERVATIPYGGTRTYGEIARELGRPGAARAVGTANGRNPVPIVIPCHRVVGSGGRLGGYGGGLALKRRLLTLEQRRTPLAGLAGAGLVLIGTAAMLACGEPERPTFPWNTDGPDTSAPRIEFLSPPANDSVFDSGDQLAVTVRISDRSPVESVTASVLGVLTFGFNTLFPDDTVVTVTYPIATSVGVTGRIELRVIASDTAENLASVGRHFVLQ